MRKLPIILFLTVGLWLEAQPTDSILANTNYFKFHSNFWINLHHFLYQKAKGSQISKLQEDGLEFLDIGEEPIIDGLSNNDHEVLSNAILYYKQNLIQTSLSRMGNLRDWLQDQSDYQLLEPFDSTQLTSILNSVSGIYRQNLWSIHHKQNQIVIQQHVEVIRNIEDETIDRLEDMAGYEWPDRKVRIDLTAYANWAGAYTPSGPDPQVYISTLDPGSFETFFIETVFHEGTHLLFSRESAFRSEIFFMSKEKGIDFPRSLWHASQFYLTGRLVQDQLKARGLNHDLIMFERDVFSQSNTSDFRSILEAYYLGKSELEPTIDNLLESLK